MSSILPDTAEKPFSPPWVSLAILALLLYGILFQNLRLEWSINPQYSYGWIIPLLVLFLLYERWPSRPPPQVGSGSGLLLFALGSIILIYPPIRLILAAHPEYYLILWMHALLVTGFMLALVHWMGGWRWVGHFAFPLLFILVAVPWPLAIEAPVMETLMGWNASFAAEMLTLAGLPALAHGNVIELRTEVLGIDEACSGVRSLQSTFMVALFLGEFYLFSPLRRSILLLVGLGLAVVTNLGRTITLALVATWHGSEVMAAWHDRIGYIVLIICIGGLWFVAWLLTRGKAKKGATGTPTRECASSLSPPPRQLPLVICLPLIGWILLAEVSIEGWFRWHERGIGKNPQWTVQWPRDERDFADQEMQERAAAVLKYSQAEAVGWRDEDGHFWSMYFIRWDPGRVSRRLGASHTPAICLPAVGHEMVERRPVTILEINGLAMPFTPYRFRRGNWEFYVYHCLWEDRDRNLPVPFSQGDRIRAALRGERNLGQRILGISLLGPESFAEAEERIIERLKAIVIPEDGK